MTPMNVFVYEHVCGGGWPQGDHVPHSLAVEGGAMLCALCEDLARLPQVAVTTMLDSRCRLTMPPGVRATRVMSPGQAYEELFDQALRADAVFVIAPELQNTLARQVRDLREAGANLIAPPDGWLEVCSDKRRLSIPGVPMMPTFPLEQDEPHRISAEFAVLKPSFGAGSQTISVIPTADLEKLRTPPHTPPLEALIVQPYITGTAVSMGAIANSHGELTILPPARQLLSDDGYLRYEGGSVPWDTPAADAMQQIVRRCFDVLEGLQGYIGFDFVLPEATPDQPLLVEINPRLCTSYLGYRRLTDDNLARLMLPRWPKKSITWKDRRVRFTPDGSLVDEQPGEPPCG
jgi:tyramine---L-glutamate ligase